MLATPSLVVVVATPSLRVRTVPERSKSSVSVAASFSSPPAGCRASGEASAERAWLRSPPQAFRVAIRATIPACTTYAAQCHVAASCDACTHEACTRIRSRRMQSRRMQLAGEHTVSATHVMQWERLQLPFEHLLKIFHRQYPPYAVSDRTPSMARRITSSTSSSSSCAALGSHTRCSTNVAS